MSQTNHEPPSHTESSMPAAELPAYLQDELASFTPAALVDLLIRDEDRAPRMLIDECARRGDAMVEQLAAVVDQERYWTDAGGHLDSWLPLHATMILGLIPTERAGQSLVSLMRRMEKAQDQDLQDWLSGFWPAFFRNKPGTVVPAVRELVLDRRVMWYMRSLAAEVVIAAAEQVDPAALESELDWAANDKYLYGGEPVEVQSAAGVRGILVRTFGGDMAFRVYHDDGEFTDYDIRHDDLALTIDADELAAFYKLGGSDVLDHGPGVLDLQKV